MSSLKATSLGSAVFISHCSRDTDTAMRVVDALESAGVRCWVAPRDIPAGSDWNHAIMTGIASCDALLLIYSRHSVDSDPVKREVERALSRRLPVIPVRLEAAPPSPAMEYMISTSQSVEAHPPPIDRHLDTIVAAVKRTLRVAHEAPRPDPHAPPQYVGPYRVLEMLGEGGMGTVYKAEQRSPVKRTVALKLIRPGLDTKEVLARFESERQALARMNHPNVARVLDAGADPFGRPYFAMEYVPGMPITRFADDNKLSIRERLLLFKQVCDAIAHAHTKSLLHRDVKASNVLAFMDAGKPTVKVIDFGIAKALTGDRLTDRTFNTERGLAVGTYESMSPEQAEGSPDIDTRTDVYALGALLYELLSGAKPFDARTLRQATDQEIRRIIREVNPPRPSTRLSGLGETATPIAAARQEQVQALSRQLRRELDWIPLMAMRKERERRYASPLALSADVQNYLDGRPLVAAPDSVGYRVAKFVRRNKRPIAAIAALILVLVFGIAGTAAGLVEARRQREVARSNETVAKRNETLARQSEALAAETARRLEVSERDAKQRLAAGLMFAADSLLKSGEAAAARRNYTEARDLSRLLGGSEVPALCGILNTYAQCPPPLVGPGEDGRVSYSGFVGDQTAVTSLCIGPDGRTLATAHASGGVRLWDVRTGVEIRTLNASGSPADCMKFLAGGRAVVTGHRDGRLRVWPADGDASARDVAAHAAAVDALALSPDGRTLLSASDDATLKLWQTDTWSEIRTLRGHRNAVHGAAFSPDGSTAYSCDESGMLLAWDVARGENVADVQAHAGVAAIGVTVSPDGQIASCGIDQVINLWQLARGGGDRREFKRIRTLKGHSGYTLDGRFAPAGDKFFSLGRDRSVRAWDLATGSPTTVIKVEQLLTNTLDVLPEGRSVVCGNMGGQVYVWDVDPRGEVPTFTAHPNSFVGVAFSPDGTLVLAGGQDGTLHLWDVPTARRLRSYHPGKSRIWTVSLSHDLRRALVGGDDRVLQLLDLRTGTVEFTGQGHSDAVLSAAFVPGGDGDRAPLALSGGADGQLLAWRFDQEKPLRTIASGLVKVRSLSFAADGGTFASGTFDYGVRSWSFPAAQPKLLGRHGHWVQSVQMSTDGKTIVSGGWDQIVRIWGADTPGKPLRELAGHTAPVPCVTVSPDGRLVASGSADRDVRLWDAASGQLLGVFGGQAQTVTAVKLAADGRTLLSFGLDGVVRVRDIQRANDYAAFSAQLGRAREALQTRRDDPEGLKIFGEWYAMRRMDEWAADFLERARRLGADVSSLMLARCYWRCDRPADARREYQRALERREAPAAYLELCLDALRDPSTDDAVEK